MFERLMRRAAALAGRAARRRRGEIAAALSEAAPRGAEVIEVEEGVVMAGHGLGRRFALEPALRWLVVEEARDSRGRGQ